MHHSGEQIVHISKQIISIYPDRIAKATAEGGTASIESALLHEFAHHLDRQRFRFVDERGHGHGFLLMLEMVSEFWLGGRHRYRWSLADFPNPVFLKAVSTPRRKSRQRNPQLRLF
jgi:hypothetical protein